MRLSSRSAACTPVALSLFLLPLCAHAADPEVESLRQQVEALRAVVESLQRQLNQERLQAPFPSSASPRPAAEPAPRNAPTTPPAPSPTVPSEETRSPLSPKPNPATFNPDMSVAIDLVSSYSQKTNNLKLAPRGAELLLQANVDPFARAYLIANAGRELTPTEKQDPFSEIHLGLEEAAIETTSLPGGLQIRAGQFFADFTRLGKIHPHDLPFVDPPLALEKLLGGETRARGLELNWVPPVDHYLRLTFGAVDAIGAEPDVLRGTDPQGNPTPVFQSSSHRGPHSWTSYGRAATAWEASDDLTLHLGSSLMRGRDAGTRSLWGVDACLKWQPSPSRTVEVGTEWLSGRTFGELILPLAAHSQGNAKGQGGTLYAQMSFDRKWTPGVRLDFLQTQTLSETISPGSQTPDALETQRETRRALSAYLGYELSEFQRLRLQLSVVRSTRPLAEQSKTDLQAFLQWSILLGTHKHGFAP